MIDPDLDIHETARLRTAAATITPTGVSGHTNAATTIMGDELSIGSVRICGSQHDVSRRERCAQRLQTIVNSQEGKPDDRNN